MHHAISMRRLSPILFALCSRSFASKSCPSYGCPLLPLDIVFDDKARKALQKIGRNDESGIAELSSCGNSGHATLTLIGYKGGKEEEQINQDRSFIVNPFMKEGYHLSGVFDGHGDQGEIVSDFAMSETPKRLAEKLAHLESHDDEDAIVQILKDTFVEIDKDVPTGGIGGCTGSVVLRVGSKLYVANAGDSISLVATYQAQNDQVQVIFLTREDKPHLADERARIESMGGIVWVPGDLREESSRVIFNDPTTGYQTGLAMSRSIGDWDMTGVIAEPLVEVIDLNMLLCADPAAETCSTSDMTRRNVFVVSATDGMMDYISPKEIAESFATAFFRQETIHPLKAAEDLILKAADGWSVEMSDEYRDDIAVAASSVDIIS